jgi:hypothetical protein
MRRNTNKRTEALPEAEEPSAESLIRESIEAKYGPLLTREQARELLHASDRGLDDLVERELVSFQRKRGRSGSRVLIARESLIEYLVRSVR